MKFKHTCLDGQERWGQELDCEPCRLMLLAAFKGPDRPVDRTGWAGGGHLPDESRSPFDRPPAAPPGPSEHVVKCRLDKGLWAVACSCGWGLSGAYPPGEESSGRAVAETLALNHAMDQGEAP